jgi:hypothetical protein
MLVSIETAINKDTCHQSLSISHGNGRDLVKRGVDLAASVLKVAYWSDGVSPKN